MKRRDFLAQSAMLGAASMLPLSACQDEQKGQEAEQTESTDAKPRYKMGLQLFSINDAMTEDPIGTLKKVKAMGYQDFEIYGFDGEKGTYYGIPASAFKRHLDELGLTVTSGHYGFSDFLNRPTEDLQRYVDQCIKGAKSLNSPYITWPWLAPEYRNMETFRRLTGTLNSIGDQVTSAGLGFAYHNHGFEFEDHDGQNGYDLILSETDPSLVKLQMDMYWVVHSSKETPKEIIARQPGRVVMWHIKDMDKKTRDYTELGNGSIDYHTVLPDPDLSGLEYYYIEQGGNFAVNSLESASTSARYFKAELQQYL
ncbi:MAG: TIM barrel protein [Bacteroidota bacterium]